MVFTPEDDLENESISQVNSTSKGDFKRNNVESYSNQLYELVAKAVRDTKKNTIGFKTVYNNMQLDKKFMKPVYGIGCKVVSKWRINESLIKSSGILTEHPKIDKNLLRVVVTELLWGHKKIAGKGEVFDIVREKKEILTELLKEHVEEVKENELNVFFARVNPFKGSVPVVLTLLEELGFTLVETPSKYKKYLQEIVKLEPNSFMIDFHFKDLLAFNSKAKATLNTNAFIHNKVIVIQSKSSLIPVYLMDVKPGNTVLDMCAAPGMKTAIIASQLKGEGKVWAVDKDGFRFKSMIKNLQEFGVQKVLQSINCDVLHLRSKPESFDLVLLDAPCSGSGIAGRLGETDANPMRLRKLQWIQMKLLMHALTKYPNAKRVVYSTCSIYPDENEGVIDEVMERLKDELTYKLVDSHKLISGFSKGLKDYKCGSSCIRVSVEKDFANGFFVAVFDKDVTKIKTEDDKSAETAKAGNKRKHSEVKEDVDNDEEEEEDAENSDGVDSVENNEDEEEEILQPQIIARQKKGKKAKQIETSPKKMKLQNEKSKGNTAQKKNKRKHSELKEVDNDEEEKEDAENTEGVDSVENYEDEEEEIPQPQIVARQKKGKKAKQIETSPKKMKLLNEKSKGNTVQKKNKRKHSEVKEEVDNDEGEEEDAENTEGVDSVENNEDEEEEIPQPQIVARQKKGKKTKQIETSPNKMKLQNEKSKGNTVQKKNKRKHSEVKEEVDNDEGEEEDADGLDSERNEESSAEDIPQPQIIVRKKKGKRSKHIETPPENIKIQNEKSMKTTAQNKSSGKKAKTEIILPEECVVDKLFEETTNKSKKSKQKIQNETTESEVTSKKSNSKQNYAAKKLNAVTPETVNVAVSKKTKRKNKRKNKK